MNHFFFGAVAVGVFALPHDLADPQDLSPAFADPQDLSPAFAEPHDFSAAPLALPQDFASALAEPQDWSFVSLVFFFPNSPM